MWPFSWQKQSQRHGAQWLRCYKRTKEGHEERVKLGRKEVSDMGLNIQTGEHWLICGKEPRLSEESLPDVNNVQLSGVLDRYQCFLEVKLVVSICIQVIL